jgi:ElaA protein
MTASRYLRLALVPLGTVILMQSSVVVSRSFANLGVTELHDILRLRGDVFVVEQACVYADIDGRDTEPTTDHHWIERSGSIATYARTLADHGATRMGRVVTAPRFRGDGLAAVLVTHIVETYRGRIVLDAQSYLVGWYERMGFVVTGPEFVDDGIPHVPMAIR